MPSHDSFSTAVLAYKRALASFSPARTADDLWHNRPRPRRPHKPIKPWRLLSPAQKAAKMTQNNKSAQRRKRHLLELDLYAIARLTFSANNATKETPSTV